jgi:hypothetical protein
LSASISPVVNAKDNAPTFSPAWLLFFAPGIGSTISFSISQRSACLGYFAHPLDMLYIRGVACE